MGLLDSIIGASMTHPLIVLLFLPGVLLALTATYRVFFHPLAHIPGPVLPKISSLWLYYHAYIGDEATVIHAAHAAYGPLVRVAPNEVDISDADAIAPIYVTRGGFAKAPCYGNFDIDGHKTIFSTTDADYRAPRARAVAPLFATKCLRASENEAALSGCVERLVSRMADEARSGRPVNVLNLARSLAVDAVSTHLFQTNYNGTAEKGARLSVSAFVDAFVAVGRFFYLPAAVFAALDQAIAWLYPDERTSASMEVVDRFVSHLVDTTPSDALNFPGRLLGLGLERAEVKAQCKDLIFAGTDSTGMNLATICRQLAMHPDKYATLRAEVQANARAGPARVDIQALPYLSAVVREGLRLSMANPTRLPHVVPRSGWIFKGTPFPAGTLVGCSAFEMHFNETIFPRCMAFEPERWLDAPAPAAATTAAQKAFFAFGAGPRACIARNLATLELFMATERLAERDVLRGARAVQPEVEIYEWFNSSVKGEKIELIWDSEAGKM